MMCMRTASRKALLAGEVSKPRMPYSIIEMSCARKVSVQAWMCGTRANSTSCASGVFSFSK